MYLHMQIIVKRVCTAPIHSAWLTRSLELHPPLGFLGDSRQHPWRPQAIWNPGTTCVRANLTASAPPNLRFLCWFLRIHPAPLFTLANKKSLLRYPHYLNRLHQVTCRSLCTWLCESDLLLWNHKHAFQWSVILFGMFGIPDSLLYGSVGTL